MTTTPDTDRCIVRRGFPRNRFISAIAIGVCVFALAVSSGCKTSEAPNAPAKRSTREVLNEMQKDFQRDTAEAMEDFWGTFGWLLTLSQPFIPR